MVYTDIRHRWTDPRISLAVARMVVARHGWRSADRTYLGGGIRRWHKSTKEERQQTAMTIQPNHIALVVGRLQKRVTELEEDAYSGAEDVGG